MSEPFKVGEKVRVLATERLTDHWGGTDCVPCADKRLAGQEVVIEKPGENSSDVRTPLCRLSVSVWNWNLEHIEDEGAGT